MAVDFCQGWSFIRLIGSTAALCLTILSARGAVETVEVSMAPVATGYNDVLNIPAFDSSLGTLQSVSIHAKGTGGFTQLVENTSASPETAVVSQSLQLVLNLPGHATPILALRQNEDHEYRLGAFDGQLDFNGDSGANHAYPVTASGQVNPDVGRRPCPIHRVEFGRN